MTLGQLISLFLVLIGILVWTSIMAYRDYDILNTMKNNCALLDGVLIQTANYEELDYDYVCVKLSTLAGELHNGSSK